MKHYAGLDVSVKETAICIVDENGRICREAKVVSHPEDLSKALTETEFRIERIGLEAGPLSQWLFEGMAGTCPPGTSTVRSQSSRCVLPSSTASTHSARPSLRPQERSARGKGKSGPQVICAAEPTLRMVLSVR